MFVILDDVWNKEVLEQLDLAKRRGSVTLVTTRNQPVLEKAGVIDEDEVKVGVLSKEDSWKLFCVHAFPTGFSNIPSQLQRVVELVADECKGLPLALKVIGGSMAGKTTRQEWEFQLNCLRESRELPGQQEEEALFGRLKLSYDNLDNYNPVSKECFLSFAAMPEDFAVNMTVLIVWWKVQGLLDDPTNMSGDDPTQFAYYLVGMLIARSLIEVDRSEYSPSSCRVHDVMRDLALHIIERQKLITCLYRPGKELVEFPRDWIQRYKSHPCEVRKLSLMENDLTTLNGVTFSAPKLEVLLLCGNEELEAIPKQFLKGIENLKVLDLSGCDKLKSLPRQIGNLTQLTHLDLQGCEELNSLPKEVGKLTQLIYLDLADCPTLKYLPSTMGDLRSLEYLNLLGGASNGLWGKPSWKLYSQAFAVDICELTALTELIMTGETCEIVELCNQLLKLVSKLVKLKMFRIYEFGKLETLPAAIQSMVHLEEFGVYSCKLIKTLPSCITMFSKLKVLELWGMLESLQPLNTLTMLSTLSIMGCTLIKKLPDSFTSSDAFPSLKELDCSHSGLVEFSEVKDGAMGKLRILNLNATGIKSLPDTLIYLKNLEVVYISKNGFDDLCKKFENSCLSGKFKMES